ncbi:uncharacterized protein LOC134256089 [Saccostrea cucullata]|uniref:uncharacterized protein LOC134256089 n=1 Tax=Saccostrea cuccullata TaxID=36930 RepID=UPI002ED17C25
MSGEVKRKNTRISPCDRQQRKLPPNFDFYADFVVVPSTEEEERVGPFVKQIKEILNDCAPRDIVVTHCGDAKFYMGEYLERSSVVLYFFTKLSKAKYAAYTCKTGFQDFLYGKRFIPVLGEKEVILPLNAKIATPLAYLKISNEDIRSMLLKLYEKHKHIRKERQNKHREKEIMWLKRHGAQTTVPEKSYQGMHITATNVMIGDNNTMVTPSPVEDNDDDKEDMHDQNLHLSQTNSMTSVYYQETDENRGFRPRDLQFPLHNNFTGVDHFKDNQTGYDIPCRYTVPTFTENENTQEKEVFSEETFVKQVHQSSSNGSLFKDPPTAPVLRRTPLELCDSPSNDRYANYKHKKPANDARKELDIEENRAGNSFKKSISKQIPDEIIRTNNLSNSTSSVSNFNFPPNIPFECHIESNNRLFTSNGGHVQDNVHLNFCSSPAASTSSQLFESSSSNQAHSPSSFSNDHRSSENTSLSSSTTMHRGYEVPIPMAIDLSSFPLSSFSDRHQSSNAMSTDQNKTVSHEHLRKDILSCIPRPFSADRLCGYIEGDKDEIVNDLKKK